MKKVALFLIVLLLLAVGIVLYQKQQGPTGGGGITNFLSPGENQKAKEISLNISSPNDGAVVTGNTITVSGQTVANADVNINDTNLKADANGDFSTTVNLDEGDNTIIVVANDANGQSAEKEITVTYEPPVTSQ